MQVRVKRDQDGIVVCIPNELLSKTNITPNSLLQVDIIDGKLILTKSFVHQNLVERAADYNGELKLSKEVVWGKSAGELLLLAFDRPMPPQYHIFSSVASSPNHPSC